MADTIKMKAPDNSGPFERNGVTYEIDADGCVSVPGALVGDLVDHGFQSVPDLPPVPIDPEDDPTFVPSEEIATMNRNELFAYLKAKGVSVSPPITNDELRKLASQPVAPAPVVAPSPIIPPAASAAAALIAPVVPPVAPAAVIVPADAPAAPIIASAAPAAPVTGK
jgi:hypothetical protein